MKSPFSFISNSIRKKNIEIVFEHILELVAISNSEKYSQKSLISSFRKTIIVNTASIIEALLLEKLYTMFGEEIPLKESWKYYNVKTLHSMSEEVQIICGARKKTQNKKKLQKLNFVEINRKCKDLGFFDEILFKEIEKVRELRNRLHIWGLKNIDKEYTKRDLEFVFSIAAKVKKLFS